MLKRVRAVTLTNFAPVARHVGLDPHAQLSAAGIKPDALSNPEKLIAAARVVDLLENCAAQSGRDDFGVLLGEARTFGSLGPVSLLMRHEPDLRAIIAAMIEYSGQINELLQISIEATGSTAIVAWNLVPGFHSSQAINLLATVAYRVLVDGSGCAITPDCLYFRHSRPENLATFKRVFRCPLEFDSSFDGTSFPSTSLLERNSLADPELTAHARRLLKLSADERHHQSRADQVRADIAASIALGQASLEDIAASLGIASRTLQRALIEEGTSFSELLDEVRRHLAVRCLSDSTQSITTVAHLTGYSSPSSFTRWFSAEFGTSPAMWRKQTKSRAGVIIKQTH